MFLINLKPNKGFTIVETLVAITILMISVVGPLTIVQKGMNAAIFANTQVTASYLAEDAMEYVKNVKDNNLIYGRSWLTNLNPCTSASPCDVNTIGGLPYFSGQTGITICSSNCEIFLTSNGYNHDSTGQDAVRTVYKRIFYITPSTLNPSDEATFTVEVKWTENGGIENVTTYTSEAFNVIK